MKLSAPFVNGYNAFVKGESANHYANILNETAIDSLNRGWREAQYSGANELIAHEYNDTTFARLAAERDEARKKLEEAVRLLAKCAHVECEQRLCGVVQGYICESCKMADEVEAFLTSLPSGTQ